MENPFRLISIIIHPIRKVRVFPYYARSNEKLKENFRAAISEGKSWQMESPKNSCATEQIGFILVEDHLVCFCSIANFEQEKHHRHSIANIGQNPICSKRVRRHITIEGNMQNGIISKLAISYFVPTRNQTN